MANLAKAFVALAALAFILAVLTALTGPILVGAEAYSHAANNLALLALCLFLGFKEGRAA
ncbi:MAG TPA: hypothetical protein VLH75_10775 [Longimicrobiales bacterium]|nr:hypothetical protein [Longimicrobiales bacterium]